MTIRTLFLDGSYSHADWPITGGVLRNLLRSSPLLRGTHVRAPDPTAFHHDFRGYDLIVPFYSPVPDEGGAPLWPATTRAQFERAVGNGCGLLILHATSNAFASWSAFNQMIGRVAGGGVRRKPAATSTSTRKAT